MARVKVRCAACTEPRLLADLMTLIEGVDETAIVDHADIMSVPDFQRTDEVRPRIVCDIQIIEIFHSQRLRVRLRAEQCAPLAMQVFDLVVAVQTDQRRHLAGDDGAAFLSRF